MWHRKSFLLISTLLPVLALAANNIQRSEDNSGVVEFSNVGVANAGSGQTVIYKSRSGDGVVFSDQKPQHAHYEILRYDCFACNPNSAINWHTITLNTSAYRELVNKAAQQYGVSSSLVRAIIHAESSFNIKAISKQGAKGLMQLMPATAKELGVQDAFNPQQNIFGGVQYLAQLLQIFNGNIKLATAAYNAGPGAVKKYGGIPPYSETKVYVERVGILHQRYQRES